MSQVTILLSVILTILVGFLLYFAQSFFIPLSVAIVVGYIIISIAEGARKLKLGPYQIPRFFCYLFSLTILGWGAYLIVTVVTRNVNALLLSADIYQERLKAMFQNFFIYFDKDPPEIGKLFEGFDFVSVISQVVFMITDAAGSAGLIAIYVLFLIIEYRYFDVKLKALFRNEENQRSARRVLSKIASQVQHYLRLKTFFSAATGLASYLVLIAVGVDFPDFWAFMIFLLNYIPTFGSIVATVFPCLLTLVQFDTLAPFLIVTISLVSIQFIMGNFLEPKFMGKHFNLSGFVIILSLTIWGGIWGIMGMFIGVPLTMIMSIVLSNFPKTRPIAVLLSENGDVD